MNGAENRAEEFISLYNEIDHFLRVSLHEEKWVSYHELVERSAKFNRIVREYEEDLKQIGDLRNAIVHRSTGEIIAIPSERIVLQAREILKKLKAPPPVIPMFQKEIVIAEANESVARVIKIMKDNDFSKIPIYSESNFLFLATAEAIVRYISENLTVDLRNSKIENVASYMEHRDNCQFVSKDTDIFKVAEIFEIYHRNGEKLDAIIITESGDRNQRPIGMITLFDVGMIYKNMEIRVNKGTI